jgi:hypothetical protein
MLLTLDNPRTNPRVTGWCPECHEGWTGTRDAHCASCHRHFGSEQAFDAHQRVNKHGRTVCRDPLKLRGKLVLDGRTWREADMHPPAAPAAARGPRGGRGRPRRTGCAPYSSSQTK